MNENKELREDTAAVVEEKPVIKAAPVIKPVKTSSFKERKLKAINAMTDAAKARALAYRVLRNK